MRLPREQDIVNSCLKLLKYRNIMAWRANCGAVELPGAGGKTRQVRFGIVGQADITGILPGGRRLEVECKMPHRRPTPSQEHFLAAIRRCGGVALVVHSIDELTAELDWIEKGEPS